MSEIQSPLRTPFDVLATHPFLPRAQGLDRALNEALPALAERLAFTAVERDQRGGHAAEQRELIRASGLLALTIPVDLGGLGGGVHELYRAVRQLARADSALAHVFAFHHLQLFGVQLYGGPAAQQHGARHLRDTAEQRLFWGNALNPADTRLNARCVEGGWRLQGVKGFCSGALGADRLTVSAIAEDGGLLIGIVQSLMSTIWPPGASLMIYVAMGAVLLLRPHGLLGRRG